MSNEFSGKPKEKLESIKSSMESYREGCLDTMKIVEDFIINLSHKTQAMWNQKIKEISDEIRKEI